MHTCLPRPFRLFFGVFLLLLICGNLYAQDILKGRDLSKMKVDLISDTDILKLFQQLKQSSVSLSQAEQMALAKGMPVEEVNKLRERLNYLEKNQQASTKTESERLFEKRETIPDTYISSPKNTPSSPQVFGAQLFGQTSLSFEPNLRIATPADYQLGPDDELLLTIFGVQEASFRLTVQPEGTIYIPNVGMLAVVGLSIEEAKKMIRDRLVKTVYRSIANGSSHFTITLGNIRSIRITIIGASKPGNYTVSSLTTLFNALYLCGGPDAINSYRSIELVRNNKVFLKADLYQFLLKGDTRQNVLLKEGDVIHIPVYQKRIAVQGEVKRPGLYELLDHESGSALIHYAGGFTEKAYTAALKIAQFTNREKRIKDISLAEFDQYIPEKGDSIMVGAVLDKYENRITIGGAVYRAGYFEWKEGMHLRELIQKAEGLREDAYIERGWIYRLNPDLSKNILSFNVADALRSSSNDLTLQKNDSVWILSSRDLSEERTVAIDGEVRKPGAFLYRGNYTLQDLLLEAGGLTDAATAYRVEISRRIIQPTAQRSSDQVAEIIRLNLDSDQSRTFLLQPHDLVSVRKNPTYAKQQAVKISGEVLFPGSYAIQSKKDRISDLLQRAGGFTPAAYPEAVALIRVNRSTKAQQEEKDKVIQKELADTTDPTFFSGIQEPFIKIAVDIPAILANPAGDHNLFLEEGDELDVPKKDMLVSVSGEVYSPTKVSFEPNRSLYYYLNKAGGITDKARKRSMYVVYANGSISKVRHYFFGLIKSYPRIRTGAEIIVPSSYNKTSLGLNEVLSITSVLMSFALVGVTVLNSLK